MIQNKKLLYLILFLLVSACSSIPKNTADGCSIFSERYLWYKHAKKTERKWGTPIYIQLAIIKMESDFDWLAKPERKDAFKQNIAYHEGWGNYKNYKNNKKIISLAKRVQSQSNKYKSQLDKCAGHLNRKKYIIF